MPPDLPVLDHEQQTETPDHFREQVIRPVCIEANAQAAAVATNNRALRTKTATKDDWGVWNGPFPGRAERSRQGQVSIRVGNRDVQVHCGDA
eukprot:5693188-Pyramimonas_sp.AAC.1